MVTTVRTHSNHSRCRTYVESARPDNDYLDQYSNYTSYGEQSPIPNPYGISSFILNRLLVDLRPLLLRLSGQIRRPVDAVTSVI